MGHLRKNIIIDSTVKASGWVAKKGVEVGVKALGITLGPVAWALSFLGKRFIDKKVMPHMKATAIKAKAMQQKRFEKKLWKQGMSHCLTKEEYIALRIKRAKRNKEDV